MKEQVPLLLLLEDDPSQSSYYELLLRDLGYRVHAFAYFEDAVDALGMYEYDAFVLDLQVDIREAENRDAGGDTFMRIALEKHPNAPVAVISGFFDTTWGSRLSRLFMETTSVLYAHIEKPGEVKLIEWAQRVYDYWELRHRGTKQHQHYHTEDSRVRTIVDDLIPVVASSRLPVLITGETGTGKEEIARIIHSHPDNPYRHGRFVAVNCGAVSTELLLSELFGHVRGAYTGADRHRLGWFLEASGWKAGRQKAPAKSFLSWCDEAGNKIRYAARPENGDGNAEEVLLMNNIFAVTEDNERGELIFADNRPGTLFLDEIGDLPPAAEAALLRALDGYGIRPLGYTGPAILPDCCIIAATNRLRSTLDLNGPVNGEKQQMSGIRKELYHRIAGWVLELPPLRERYAGDGAPEWVVSLTKWAARDNIYYQDGALERLAHRLEAQNPGRAWDGNWRELRYFYVRAKSIALQCNNGKRTIRDEDLILAGQWVLLMDADRKETPAPLAENKEIAHRLDCVLVLHALSSSHHDSLEEAIAKLESEIGDEAKASLADKESLEAAISMVLATGKITNQAVDALMGRKGALKSWWRNNAHQTVVTVNARGKYLPLVDVIARLSPSNFFSANGSLRVNELNR